MFYFLHLFCCFCLHKIINECQNILGVIRSYLWFVSLNASTEQTLHPWPSWCTYLVCVILQRSARFKLDLLSCRNIKSDWFSFWTRRPYQFSFGGASVLGAQSSSVFIKRKLTSSSSRGLNKWKKTFCFPGISISPPPEHAELLSRGGGRRNVRTPASIIMCGVCFGSSQQRWKRAVDQLM